MAGRRIDLDELIEPIWAAADEIGAAMFENRNDALTERTQLCRSLFWIDIDLGKIIDVGLREYVSGVRKRRYPFAVLLHCVPADMIVMQMGTHYHIDFVRARAGSRQPFEI